MEACYGVVLQEVFKSMISFKNYQNTNWREFTFRGILQIKKLLKDVKICNNTHIGK